MKIGNLDIKGNIFLAPMCNVTNLPFRLMCKKYGAAVVYTEMINADAYIMNSEKSGKRAFFSEEERPVGIQLFGSNEEVLVKAVKKIEKELKPDMIDINIGCPAYNVMKTGCGASLLEDEKKLSKLVSSLSSALIIPLTCKMRITKSDGQTLSLAKSMEKAGAKAISVHGRTARQKYSGKSNWDVIKKIKENSIVPIILNGDVVDEISAKKAFFETNCDGIMIGRAAIGNPFLFKRIDYYIETGNLLPKQTIKEKINDFFEYVNLCEKFGYANILSIKMQAQNFIKGIEGGNRIRQKISESKDLTEVKLNVSSLLNNY